MAYDIRWACDVLRPVFDRTDGKDGRVSIEVDPRLAHDTDRTTAEAKGLWWLVDRPNVLIKIPATEAGLPSITAATAAGISVNVTLIFGLDRYDEVMDAYLTGLEQAKAAGIDLSTIRSVASFFVSRVDTEIDKRLDKIGTDEAQALRGKAGIANARLAYERYEKVVASDRWKALEAAGAHTQRPLWASTGVKDPAYDDTMYVVELVAPNTVNTMPEATLDAVADHGLIRGDAITRHLRRGRARCIDALNALGIGYDDVIEVLEVEGVQKFEDSYAQLAESVQGPARRRRHDDDPTKQRRCRADARSRNGDQHRGRRARAASRAGDADDRHRRPDRRWPTTADRHRRWRPADVDKSAARPARPAAAAGAGAVRAGRLRRHRRPGPQEAAAGRSTTWPTAACCPPTSCCSASPAGTGATATSRTLAKKAAKEHARTDWNEEVWARLSGDIKFVPGSFDDDEAFDTLAKTLDELRESHGIKGNAAFYLSIPPSHVPDGAQADGAHRDGRQRRSAGGWRRVVVEKPFGHDLASALELNELVDDVFTAAGRVPHRPLPRQGDRPEPDGAALRQPAVRAGLERQLRRLGADHDGRGRRHRRPGRVLRRHRRRPRRAAEPPAAAARADRDGGAGRVHRRGDPTEKLKVLRAITLPPDLGALRDPRPVRPGLAGRRARRWPTARRRTSRRTRRPRPTPRSGSASRPGAGPACRSTCAPASGCPRRVTEIAVLFKKAPHLPFSQTDTEELGHNQLVIRVQPDEGVTLKFGSKVPGIDDGGPRRRDGLPLRRGVHRVLPRGVRAADPRRAARRRDAVPAQRGGRGVLAGDRPARGVLGRAGPPSLYRAGEWGPEGGRRDARPRRPAAWRRP